ncbi:uncharacterized protein ZBAI_04903 [Zygosaccharomyces bailii ISA1307]|nr:uncharacterized protein ZBAI_04903 [Zygosaccharomyces bailii ISA1307]
MAKSQGALRSELLSNDYGNIILTEEDRLPGTGPSQGMQQGMQQGMPHGMPHGMSHGMPPQGAPNGMHPQGIPPQGIHNGIHPQVMHPQGIPNGMAPQGVPFRPNGLPNGVPNGIPNGLQMHGGMPGGMPNAMYHGASMGIPNAMHSGMSRGIQSSTSSPQRRAYSLNNNSISNFFRQKPRMPHRSKRSSGIDGGDDDEEVLIEDDDTLTFNDIRAMGKGEKYGFGADTAPIIPTLITKSHTNMNNTEYRKAMTAQRKQAMSAMARQRNSGASAAGNDPRAMSLQSYGMGNPFNPIPQAQQQIYPAQNVGTPRSMSMMTTQSRPPAGYMRQQQQKMFAARNNNNYNNTNNNNNNNESGPHNVKLNPILTSHTLDPGPMTPDHEHAANITSPLKNEVASASPVSPPPNAAHLNVLQLSQPQQDEYRERERLLAEREKELREKEQLVKQREAEVQLELKQKEEELERERLRRDQEMFQREEQREQDQPHESQFQTQKDNERQSQSQQQQLQDLSSCDTDDLDLKPSSTLERGLDGMSLNDRQDSLKDGSIGNQRNRESVISYSANRESTVSFGRNRESTVSFGPQNRVSTSTFMSVVSDSPEKKHKPSTGLYKLENSGNNEFFTAEEFPGDSGIASEGTGAVNTSVDQRASHSQQRNSSMEAGGNGTSNYRSKKILSKISSKSLSSKENEPGATQASSGDSPSNVSMGSFPSSNEDTFDFKQIPKERKEPVNNGTSNRTAKPVSTRQLLKRTSEPIKEESSLEDSMDGFVFDNTSGQPYQPVFAQKNELAQLKNPFKTIVIPAEQLNIITENKELMSEISIVSAELADSIKRECMLEERLRNGSSGDSSDSDESLFLLQFETELRKKSSKVVELLKQLNEQRLKRLIAEEQLLLSEHGAKPSSIDLVHKISQLEAQLEFKESEIQRLKESQKSAY